MKDKLPFNPPQLQNYLDACWIEGYFTPDEVAQISKRYEEGLKKEAEVTSNEVIEPDFRKSTVAFVQPEDPEFNNIMLRLAQVALQINSQRYMYDLLGFYEDIQIAEYGKDDFFEWHADFGNGVASNRKLSISVQLSKPEDYEGGDLQFMIGKEAVNAPRTQGTVIIFPSYNLHRVTPITAGHRRSMVGWVSGNPFR